MICNQDKELHYTWIHNSNTHFPIEEVLGKTDGDWLPEKEAANLRAMELRVLESGVGKRKNVQFTW
ncbi:MAG: hypothetical protein GY799_09725 [Desulfobulbaceae bacterium]|nr:hypothetical protein [Desulfobulbaceae bacterium]